MSHPPFTRPQVRALYDLPGEHVALFDPTTYGVGFGYADECTTLKIDYTSAYSQPIALTPTTRDQTILVQLTLRTLGEVKASSALGE